MEENNWLSPMISFLEKYRLSFVLATLGLFLIALGFIFPNLNFLPKEKNIIVSRPQTQPEKLQIQVAISGAVKNPGLYKLDSGARVNDLIASAGGFTDVADQNWIDKNLNLALVLTDAQKIYVSKIGEQEVLSSNLLGLSTQGTSKIININSASSEELDTLAGVGAVTAKKIIAGRPYSKIEDLLNKKIVGNATFEKIKDKISVY